MLIEPPERAVFSYHRRCRKWAVNTAGKIVVPYPR
ncbi:MAG: hypothetical protein [Chaetfec virus UA24_244]|nr:MAG: hypothetical protein [Chaetfec virus UA24_244]